MASPHFWHSGGRAIGGRWPIPLDLYPDELISSWLIRLALAHRCDPLSLTGSIWPEWRAWQCDPDRIIPPDLLGRLSQHSGVQEGDIRKAFLSKIAHRLFDKKSLPQGIWPWVLANGNRARWHHLGRAVCPSCLEEAPFLKIQWRLAWHVCCVEHQTKLINTCPHCGVQIQPHRLEAKDHCLTSCFSCKQKINEVNAIAEKELDANCSLQALLDQVAKQGMGIYDGKSLCAGDWFSLAGYFVFLLKKASVDKNSSLKMALLELGVPNYALLSPASGLQLELLGVQERFSLLEGAYILLNISPKELLSAFRSHSVSSSMIAEKTSNFPPALALIATSFCKTPLQPIKKRDHPHHKRPVTKRAVKQKWARLIRRVRLD